MTPHTHDHSHEGGSYQVGQLSAIGICGALGAVGLLWVASRDMFFLIPVFRTTVLAGGVALLALVAVRAVGLWIIVGQVKPEHGCDHDHGHSNCPEHEHGSGPWRYTLLLLPIVLFLMGLPNKGFSIHRGTTVNPDDVQQMSAAGVPGFMEALCADAGLHGPQETPFEVSFLELYQASFYPDKRRFYEGKPVRMKGQFDPSPTGNSKRFTLIRFRMVHCGQDAIKLPMVVDCGQELNTPALVNQWVQVTVRVSFGKKANGEMIPVLKVLDASDVNKVPPDPNYFL